jgi:hypothetical protein
VKQIHCSFRANIAWGAALALAFAASSAAHAAGKRGVELSHRMSLGYESFIDRFTILEDDTAHVVQDIYAGLGSALTVSREAWRLGVNNLFRYGNQTLDELLDFDAAVEPVTSLRMDMRGGIRYKHFLERSEYSAANDYLQGNALVRLRKRFSNSLRAGLRGRLELVDFSERTIYDYDYHYRDAGLEIEAGSGYGKAVLAAVSFGRREAPDTTALGFDRTVAELDARFGSGSLSLHAASFADRRDYRTRIRSDYWIVNSQVELWLGGAARGSIIFRGEWELLSYDRPDTIYFGSHFVRAGSRFRLQTGSAAAVFIEPRYGQMLCRDFAEERYWEGSIIIGLEAFGGERYWLAASYEPGFRDYTAAENLFYSDFYLNRFSIMGSVAFAKAFSANLFLNHEPERHTRREDDFSITLISLDITRRF